MSTKQHILQTAFRLFLEKGFSDISTNEIIRESNTTKGGFYYCFKSREDLVSQIIETYILPYYLQPIYAMQYAWEQKKNDVCTRTLLWDVYFSPQRFCKYQESIGMHIAFQDFYFLLYEGMKKFPIIQQSFAKNTAARDTYLRKILQRGKERNELTSNLDIDGCVMTTLAMQDGILALKVLDDGIDDEQKYRYMEEKIWREISAQDIYQKYIHGGVNSAVS